MSAEDREGRRLLVEGEREERKKTTRKCFLIDPGRRIGSQVVNPRKGIWLALMEPLLHPGLGSAKLSVYQNPLEGVSRQRLLGTIPRGSD